MILIDGLKLLTTLVNICVNLRAEEGVDIARRGFMQNIVDKYATLLKKIYLSFAKLLQNFVRIMLSLKVLTNYANYA